MSRISLSHLNMTIYMIIGVLIIHAGGLLNLETVATNGGRMPVKTTFYLDTSTHFAYSDPSEINFPSLSDKYYFNTKKNRYFFSIGDILISLGMLIVFIVFGLIIKLKLVERRLNLKMSDEEQKTMEIVDVDPSEMEEVDSVRPDLIDFEKYRLKNCKIESIDVVRVPTKYAKAKDGKVHRLKVTGEIVETVEIESETEKKKIEFKPSCLIGLEEDEEGKLLGYPKREKSDYQRFLKALSITNVKDALGKELPMSIHESNSGSKFLNFFYN